MEMTQFTFGAMSVIFIFFEVVAIIALIKAQKALTENQTLRRVLDELHTKMGRDYLQLAEELDTNRIMQKAEAEQKFYDAEIEI